MSNVYAANPLLPDAPFVDATTGALTLTGHRFLLSMWYRTGQGVGVNATLVQTTANTAEAIAMTGTAATDALSTLFPFAFDAPDGANVGQSAVLSAPFADVPDTLNVGQIALMGLLFGDVA